jgi:ABC-2 type transport system ATP-binding protein
VYGLIGPNGSGKSTVMKMLVGLLSPDAGECRVFGQPATATANRREIGFLPENPYFYKFLTGEETVRFYGRLCGLRGAALQARTRELLELVGLTEAKDRRLRGYSKGMLQRIGLAQALVQNPRLLVLDEPTAGVDPIGSRTIRDIILNIKQQGVTVFLCSHLLEQVQEICDRVGVLYQGCLIAEGTMDELTRDNQHSEITLRNPSPELLEQIRQLAGEAWQDCRPARNSLETVFLRGIQARLREK